MTVHQKNPRSHHSISKQSKLLECIQRNDGELTKEQLESAGFEYKNGIPLVVGGNISRIEAVVTRLCLRGRNEYNYEKTIFNCDTYLGNSYPNSCCSQCKR